MTRTTIATEVKMAGVLAVEEEEDGEEEVVAVGMVAGEGEEEEDVEDVDLVVSKTVGPIQTLKSQRRTNKKMLKWSIVVT